MKNILKVLIIFLILLMTYAIFALLRDIYKVEPPGETTSQFQEGADEETAKRSAAGSGIKTNELLPHEDTAEPEGESDTHDTIERSAETSGKTVPLPAIEETRSGTEQIVDKKLTVKAVEEAGDMTVEEAEKEPVGHKESVIPEPLIEEIEEEAGLLSIAEEEKDAGEEPEMEVMEVGTGEPVEQAVIMTTGGEAEMPSEEAGILVEEMPVAAVEEPAAVTPVAEVTGKNAEEIESGGQQEETGDMTVEETEQEPVGREEAVIPEPPIEEVEETGPEPVAEEEEAVMKEGMESAEVGTGEPVEQAAIMTTGGGVEMPVAAVEEPAAVTPVAEVTEKNAEEIESGGQQEEAGDMTVEETEQEPVGREEAVIPEPPIEEVEETGPEPVAEEEEAVMKAGTESAEVGTGEPVEQAVIMTTGGEAEMPSEEAGILVEEMPVTAVQEPAAVTPVAEVTEKPGEFIQAGPQPEETEGMTVKEAKKEPLVINKEEALKNIEKRIALYPFENLTNNADAMKYVMPLLIKLLGEKGLTIIDEEILHDFLCEKRVRSTGYVSHELAEEIGEKFVVKAILVGSVVAFSNDEKPQFAILSRLIDSSDGTIIWADYESASGEDFTKILGLGRVKTISALVPKVMDRLLESFSMKSSYKKAGNVLKIAVMPFQNNTRFMNAGKIASYMFLDTLLKNNKFEPIEYGNIRKLVIDLRLRNRGELDYEKIGAVSEQLNAGGILVGVVDLYTNGAVVSAPPMVSISVRLLDSRQKKIIWYNSEQLDGEKDIIALDWGRIRSVDKVAYKVISNLVEEMKTVKIN